MNTAVIVLSGGGLKSAAVAARLAPQHQLVFVHAAYGQRSAAMELQALRALVPVYPGARLVALELPHLMRVQEQLEGAERGPGTAFTSGVVGSHVLSPTSLRGLLPVLLQAAVQCAWRIGATQVMTGLSRLADTTHLGLPGNEGRPDRLREFLHAYQIMLDSCSASRHGVAIESPFVDMAYPDIIRLAAHLETPLDRTWTCDRGGSRPCGRCQPCTARAEAFVAAGLADPVLAIAAAGVLH